MYEHVEHDRTLRLRFDLAPDGSFSLRRIVESRARALPAEAFDEPRDFWIELIDDDDCVVYKRGELSPFGGIEHMTGDSDRPFRRERAYIAMPYVLSVPDIVGTALRIRGTRPGSNEVVELGRFDLRQAEPAIV